MMLFYKTLKLSPKTHGCAFLRCADKPNYRSATNQLNRASSNAISNCWLRPAYSIAFAKGSGRSIGLEKDLPTVSHRRFSPVSTIRSSNETEPDWKWSDRNASRKRFQENAAEWDGIRRSRRRRIRRRGVTELLPDRPGWEHLDIGTDRQILKIISPKAKRAVGIDLARDAHRRLHARRAGVCQLSCATRRHATTSARRRQFRRRTISSCTSLCRTPGVGFRSNPPLRPGGKVIVVDFAPHDESHLRTEHAHRWLGDGQRNAQLVRSRRLVRKTLFTWPAIRSRSLYGPP